jgi:hypothetical protein
MFTIFANIIINDSDRLDRFKRSFLSFRNISDNWLINIRGSLRENALDFLRVNLGERMIEFSLLDDKRGWINNALVMLKEAKYDYIMIWLEDHMSVADENIYKKILIEMSNSRVDYIMYSWWLFGNAREKFEESGIITKKMDNIDVIDLNVESWHKVVGLGYEQYLISLVGIFKKEFLYKLFILDNKLLPLFISKIVYKLITLSGRLFKKVKIDEVFDRLNTKFFNNRLPRFSKETPFNLEKRQHRIDLLPIRVGVPREELFACIDDNQGVPGYCLQERALNY